MTGESCGITDKGKSCSTTPAQEPAVGLKEHWNNAYLNNAEDKLGWYEEFPQESICLIDKCNLSPDSVILNVGAGTTTLIGFLLLMGYTNIIATDISNNSLAKLKTSLGDEGDKITWIVDDLTKPVLLKNIPPVDLWIDRAVLHFFTEARDQDTYFELLKSKIRKGGFVLFAEFNLNGATKCSGLPIHRYNEEMLSAKLGDDFSLTNSFNHLYSTPSGAERPYVYTLFRKTG
jgi:hypothetical protein